MDKLAAREKEVFAALEALVRNRCAFVVIGGYAVNAYALPRFSVDCDIVVREGGWRRVGKTLLSCGFVRVPPAKHAPYANFLRLEKEVLPEFLAAFDVLAKSVHDRQSGSNFSADWLFSHSSMRTLPAKTFAGNLLVRIISPDALFVMKFCCARGTDVRDIFMLCDKVEDWGWVRQELASRVNFAKQHRKIMEKLSGKEFRKDLGGVFGYVEPAAFEKRLRIMAGIAKR